MGAPQNQFVVYFGNGEVPALNAITSFRNGCTLFQIENMEKTPLTLIYPDVDCGEIDIWYWLKNARFVDGTLIFMPYYIIREIFDYDIGVLFELLPDKKQIRVIK